MYVPLDQDILISHPQLLANTILPSVSYKFDFFNHI